MPYLTWSLPARGDLKRLHDFLAEKDRKAAKRAIETIRNSANLLRKYPEIGRFFGDEYPGIRQLVIRFGRGGYIALYRYERNTVTVLAVRHSREEHSLTYESEPNLPH